VEREITCPLYCNPLLLAVYKTDSPHGKFDLAVVASEVEDAGLRAAGDVVEIGAIESADVDRILALPETEGDTDIDAALAVTGEVTCSCAYASAADVGVLAWACAS